MPLSHHGAGARASARAGAGARAGFHGTRNVVEVFRDFHNFHDVNGEFSNARLKATKGTGGLHLGLADCKADCICGRHHRVNKRKHGAGVLLRADYRAGVYGIDFHDVNFHREFSDVD